MHCIYRRFGPHFVAGDRYPMTALTTEQRNLLELGMQNEWPVSKPAPPPEQLNNQVSIYTEYGPGGTIQNEGRRKSGGAPKRSEQNKPATVTGCSGGKAPEIEALSADLSKGWKDGTGIGDEEKQTGSSHT